MQAQKILLKCRDLMRNRIFFHKTWLAVEKHGMYFLPKNEVLTEKLKFDWRSKKSWSLWGKEKQQLVFVEVKMLLLFIF